MAVTLVRPAVGNESEALQLLLPFTRMSTRVTGVRSTGTSLNVSWSSFGDRDMALIPQLPDLRGFAARDTLISDASLEVVFAQKGLRALDLSDTAVGDAGFRNLRDLGQLESLSLCRTNVGDLGLRELAHLPRLKRLDLSCGTKITDHGLESLKDSQTIEDLDLMKTEVTDRGMQFVGSMKQLRSLDLRETRVTGAGLKHLNGLRRLETLSLAGCRVGDADLEELRNHPNLETLDLSGAEVTDGCAGVLVRLGQLRDLDLSGNMALTDDGLRQLVGLRQLESLKVSGTQVTINGLEALSQLPKLRTIGIPSRLETPMLPATLAQFGQLESVISVGITDASLKILAPARMIHLTTNAKGAEGKRPRSDGDVVTLDARALITDQEIGRLGSLTKLEALDMRYAPITDEGLRQLKGLRNLKDLNVVGTKVGHDGLHELLQSGNVSTLRISNSMIDTTRLANFFPTRQIVVDFSGETDIIVCAFTREKLLHLLSCAEASSGMRAVNDGQIRNIYLMGTKVTDLAMSEMWRLPNLQLLDIRGTGVSESAVNRLREAHAGAVILK